MVARAGFRVAPGFDGSARPYGSVRLTRALWQRRLVLPPAGDFSPRKSPQNAPGAAAPGPRLAPRRASPGEALRKQLLSTGLSRPLPPTPSRLRAGQSNRRIVTATQRSSKAAPAASERGGMQHTAAIQPLSHGFAVRAPLAQGSLWAVRSASLCAVGAASSRPLAGDSYAAAANVPAANAPIVGARIARPLASRVQGSPMTAAGVGRSPGPGAS